jgi:Na+/H+ antiporter NhaD/arsenite permease-like protein
VSRRVHFDGPRFAIALKGGVRGRRGQTPGWTSRAGATDLSFTAFIVNLAPIAALTFAIVTAGLYGVFRSRLRVQPHARARVMRLDARRSIEDMAELKRTVPVLVVTILAFFAHQALHLEPATVALSGASVMLLVSRQPLERSLAGIEWPTLFFFVGLFVMVGALEHTGAIREVANGIADVTGGDRTAELLGITWASAIGSGLVDNIPFTAAMVPVVEQLQAGNGDDAYWWALALGACFGGNATLVAAAANVAAAGMAARAGQPIGFMSFLRIGLPVTFVSLLLATAYIAVRYL